MIGSFIGASIFLTAFVSYLKRKSTLSAAESPLSTVSAASTNMDDSSLPPTRRFNFIADVVEKAAEAVVYIELKDRYLKQFTFMKTKYKRGCSVT